MKKYSIRVNGVPFEVEVELLHDDEDTLPAGIPSRVASQTGAAPVTAQPFVPPPGARLTTLASADGGSGTLSAPLTGVIAKIHVKVGQAVKRGDLVLEIEAMKMNTKVYAPADGKVQSIQAKEGENVQQGQSLMNLGGD